MSCTNTTPWTVQDYLTAAGQVGLPPGNFVPSKFQSICSSVAASSIPAKAPATFQTACTASLIVRGIVYFKCVPGDCGVLSPIGLNDAALTGVAGSAAGAGLKIGSAIAGAGSTISAVAGAVLPGIGVAVSVLQQIFANHAAAVANEQTTICKVAGLINQVIPFYDNAVRTGQISPTSAYAGMQNYLNQVISALDGIQKSCDAACVYIAILQAHYTFVERYYPLIAPNQYAPAAPGAPPVIANIPPGGVGLATYQPAAATLPPPATPPPSTVVDYFGNVEPYGYQFFGSPEGIATLPLPAGAYFTAAQLKNNPWNLTAESPIDNAQYSAFKYNGNIPMNPGGSTSGVSSLSTNDLLFIAGGIVLLVLVFSGKINL